MTQPRVFVTYVPSRRAPRAGPGHISRRAPEPVMVVLAGALLAGGTVHALGSADAAGAPRPAPAPQDPGVTEQADRPAPDALPYLALATVDPPPRTDRVPEEAAPAAKLSAGPSVPRSVPGGPRRDLAGFLEDRGLTLATSEPAAGTAPDVAFDDPVAPDAFIGPVAASETAAGTKSAAPLTEPGAPPALALAVDVAAAAQEDALSSVPNGVSEQALSQSGSAIEAQTFPIVAVGGQRLGAVTMRGDRVHLASLVGLLQLKLPAAEFERLAAAPAADSFVALDTLRAAGISVTLDPAGEQMRLSAR